MELLSTIQLTQVSGDFYGSSIFILNRNDERDDNVTSLLNFIMIIYKQSSVKNVKIQQPSHYSFAYSGISVQTLGTYHNIYQTSAYQGLKSWFILKAIFKRNKLSWANIVTIDQTITL